MNYNEHDSKLVNEALRLPFERAYAYADLCESEDAANEIRFYCWRQYHRQND